jgi:cell division protease FtsH
MFHPLFLLLVLFVSECHAFGGAYSNHNPITSMNRRYPLSRKYTEQYLRRLNGKNATLPNTGISDLYERSPPTNHTHPRVNGLQIIINAHNYEAEDSPVGENQPTEDFDLSAWFHQNQQPQQRSSRSTAAKKSENFEVVMKSPISFKDVGGYTNIKSELEQCVDILKNHTKYAKYNVRIPKGLILEGPPGTGKTLLAKALAGEANTAFIPVSGSQFQEMYVGVGAARVRELFDLAKKNVPCIIFIDEIDALGRKRSGDRETSTTERDNTLNELLVALDGFKNVTGVFLIGATNRADLLDPALLRPGRIDKRVYIGMPDEITRKSILKIHSLGKPTDGSVIMDDLVEMTAGLSGAQIENLLNEALLNALRDNRETYSSKDIDHIMNKILVGWQPIEHKFSESIIDHIVIHEMGHAVLACLVKNHAKMRKVIINLSAPTSPGYTVFEANAENIHTRESLFEHLMILLGGRIAEEIFYEESVSTGALNDFEEAHKLAEKMILYYGMGLHLIYPSKSEKYKEKIDEEVNELLMSAHSYASFILKQSKDLIKEGADILKRDRMLSVEDLNALIQQKYGDLIDVKPYGQ